MTKIKLSINNRFTGEILFEYEKDDNTIKDTLEQAVKDGANLDGANLTRANLYGANLDGANLTRANLYGANLDGANLYGANLDGANLTRANLYGANLTPYKDDFFAVLLRSIPEVAFLKKNIIEGKIDGSTYDGDCACLSGTLVNGAKLHNGPKEKALVECILSVRNSRRPIEMFFALIKKGDTPETNPAAKLALEWLEEFQGYLKFATA